MAKIGLILTTDHEVFGNGSGSVTKCMLEPLSEMASIANEFSVPLTIFLDVCEFWAFKETYAQKKLKVDEASLIADQLCNLHMIGHDVQLHLHPQWLRYKQLDGNWHLDYSLWSIAKLNYEDPNEPELGLKNILQRGKETLETILKEVNPNYICNSFRAGAWSMQPEADVLRAMREVGLRIDSTVVPGMNRNDGFSQFDFRNAPDKAYWYVNDSFSHEVDEGILEVPIFSLKISLLKRLIFNYWRFQRRISFKPAECIGNAESSRSKSKVSALKTLFTESQYMFTFSDAKCSEEMIYLAKQAQKRYSNDSRALVPIVAISHPKTFANAQEFRRFLIWAKGQQNIEFITFQNLLNE